MILFSTEHAEFKIMKTPEGSENAFLCYFDWDVNNACQRFLISEEGNPFSNYC